MPDTTRRKMPWQQSFRRIPKKIHEKLALLGETPLVVAGSKLIKAEELQRGQYDHLDIRLLDGRLSYPKAVLPLAKVGRYSTRNVEGWENKRIDLPKIIKSRPMEAPNYGDWSNGSHTVWMKQEVYQLEIHEPRDHSIQIEVLKESDSNILFKFSIDIVLDPKAQDFESDLFFCLQLLQENTGVADVFQSEASREEFLKTVNVEWEIFPPGTSDEVMQIFMARRRSSNSKESAVMRERVEAFAALKPTAYIEGRSGLNRYIGAIFADDLVVFENLRYGNALYVLYEDWEDLSKRSRKDLLRGTSANFDRVIHNPGWQSHLQGVIRSEIRERRQ